MIYGLEITTDNARRSVCIIDGKKWPCIVVKEMYVFKFFPEEIGSGGYISDEAMALDDVEEVVYSKEEFNDLVDKLRAEIYFG